jgi:hypothetical protein
MTMPSSTRDAERADAEQMLGDFRNRARVAYDKTGKLPKQLTGSLNDGGCGVAAAELESARGKFRVRDAIEHRGEGRARLWCDSLPANRDHPDNLVLDFNWNGTENEFTWNGKKR